MPDRVRLIVPSETRSLSLVEALVESFGASLEIPAEEVSALVALGRDLVRFTLAHAYPGDPTGEIEISLDLAGDEVRVEVHDWGLPLTAAGGELGALPPGLAEIATRANDVRLVNLGADGKRISASKRVSHAADVGPEAHEFEAPARRAEHAQEGVLERITVRLAGREDFEAISQLLYENYHLTYGHADFYRPRWLAERVHEGSIVSSVAVYEDQVVGHHALMVEEGWAARETGAAVVNSAFRGLGILGRLFENTLGEAKRLALPAVFGRAVTVHPYSQRAERANGYRETALVLGAASARMTMHALAEEGGRRTALLHGYRVLSPSLRTVRLPHRYRSLIESAYAHVGLDVGSAGAPAADERDPVVHSDDPKGGRGSIVVAAWNARAARRALRQLLARHVDVVYADLDLHTLVDPDEAVSTLNELGFFYAGVLLYGLEGHDYLRLQLLNAENIETEAIVCDGAFARDLLSAVLDDRARVGA